MALSSLNALAQNTATIDTARATPLNSHFSGFNDGVVFPAEPLADGLSRTVGYGAPFAMHAEKAICRPVRSSSARWRVIS
jgi:hypothetical protein